MHTCAGGLDPSVSGIANLCAVVTVTDDGGSSGRLRKEFNILPPGDIRNCIAALSEDEALLSHLFQHRFHAGAGLSGHSFGNLFLTALTTITGDFAKAVKQSSEILATRGHIYPSTVSDVQLEALMADGTRVVGETNITASTGRIVEIHLNPPDVRPLPQTLDAIANADLITIGPGSLFTSLVPNLLVHGIPEAIAASRAVKAFVCNLMTEANESLGLSAADHIRVLNSHARLPLVDYAIVNQTPVPSALKAKYAAGGGSPIDVDVAAMETLGSDGHLRRLPRNEPGGRPPRDRSRHAGPTTVVHSWKARCSGGAMHRSCLDPSPPGDPSPRSSRRLANWRSA